MGVAEEASNARDAAGNTVRSTLAAGAAGNFLEWYDFGLYGSLSRLLGKPCFPDASESQGLLGVFAIFAASYPMRPAGSLVFGRIW